MRESHGSRCGQCGRQLRFAARGEGLADVVLVDIVEGVPQGKALDLLQSGPCRATMSF